MVFLSAAGAPSGNTRQVVSNDNRSFIQTPSQRGAIAGARQSRLLDDHKLHAVPYFAPGSSLPAPAPQCKSTRWYTKSPVPTLVAMTAFNLGTGAPHNRPSRVWASKSA